MVRYLFILLSVVLLNNTKCSDAKKSANTVSTVFITSTGKKYHLENCRALKKSKIAITINEAIVQGYTPCKLCNPPAAGNPDK